MRKLIKRLIYYLFYLLVLPAGLSSLLFHRVFKYKNCFLGWGEFFSLVPGPPGLIVRTCFYNQTLSKSDSSLVILFGSHITHIDSEIGRDAIIGGHTTIGRVDLGDRVAISNHVSVLSGRRQHNFEDPDQDLFAVEETFEKITIGNNTFIGDQCTIMADIGERSIIGAGSIVVKEIPSYSVAVGNPARVVKDRREKSE